MNVNNGFGDLVSKIQTLPEAKRNEIEADIEAAYINGPDIALVIEFSQNLPSKQTNMKLSRAESENWGN